LGSWVQLVGVVLVDLLRCGKNSANQYVIFGFQPMELDHYATGRAWLAILPQEGVTR